MYGGLFGDLPPTKKEAEGQQQPPEKKRPRHDGQILLPRPRLGAKPAMAPAPVVAATNTATTTTTTTALPSVVSRLGVSGTAVAFVPAAVRNKRITSSITVTTSGATTSSSQEPPHAAPTRASINQGNYNAKEENYSNADKSMAYGNDRQSQQREEQNHQQQQYDGTSRIDKLQDSTSNQTQKQQLMPAGTGGIEEWKTMADAAGEMGVSQYFNDGPSTQRMIHNNNNNNNNNKRSTTSNSGDSYEAPHSRKQQEDDRYDPFVPNDLLEYWERLAVQRALEEQEQQRREIEQRLAEEERLRQQRRQQEREQQQQRQRLEQEAAAASARNSEPYGYTNQRPLGRGRGVSNLPAWLVEKKRRESEGGPGGRR